MIDYDALFRATLLIECIFKDNIGNLKSAYGTGIALIHKNELAFVTNRHIVDSSLKYPDTKLLLSEMFIWCRRKSNPSIDFPPEKFKVAVDIAKVLTHSTADVAVISNIKFYDAEANNPIINPILEETLAKQDFFKNEITASDPCVFIGYPANNINHPWWDTELGLPIVRLANIASHPKYDFKNDNIRSTHARLVTGLSFSGSSGSPILNLGSQLKSKDGYISPPNPITPKIIGIMGGHWWEDNKQIPEMLKHTGLSYFITSIAISELLEKI